MAYDSTFLLRVKDLVTEQLKYIGAFIDDELPDYIMVMVANRKSESGMAKDLQLFLGEHTKKFTEWLHLTLQNMKANDFDSKEEKLPEPSPRSNRVSTRKKSQKNVSSVAPNEPRVRRHRPVSRSRSPADLPHVSKANAYTREPHEEADLVSLDATEDEFAVESSNAHNVKEERKIMITSSLGNAMSSRLSNEKRIDLSSNLRSVVEVKNNEYQKVVEHSKPRSGSTQASCLLLKRAVNEAKANTNTGEAATAQLQLKRKRITRPTMCSDVTSSSQSDSTKFFINLSENESARLNSLSHGYLRGQSAVADTNHLTGVRSRLGSRLVNSTSTPIGSRVSVKQRLGPIVSAVNRIHNLQDAEECEFDGPVEGDYVDLSYDDYLETGISNQAKPNELHLLSTASKMRLVDRLTQSNPELVVNLNETDEDEDVAAFPMETKKKNSTKTKQMPAIADNKNDTSGATIPSSLERCKFWPNCRNRENCQFIHPTEPCPAFPRCRFGPSCTFIHPTCRFGTLCSRPNCPFTHTIKPATPTLTATPNQIVCRFQNRCTNSKCPFYHPPPVIQAVPHRAVANSMGTMLTSPVPCRYGSACSNRSKCPFYHQPDLPKVDQLKWIAPSKKQPVDTASSNSQIDNLKLSINVATATVPVHSPVKTNIRQQPSIEAM